VMGLVHAGGSLGIASSSYFYRGKDKLISCDYSPIISIERDKVRKEECNSDRLSAGIRYKHFKLFGVVYTLLLQRQMRRSKDVV